MALAKMTFFICFYTLNYVFYTLKCIYSSKLYGKGRLEKVRMMLTVKLSLLIGKKMRR
jgi:hypothetical protein